jgi:catechol 2,3-dioxygenase-like lactoylglutathione lyase family enzyme
MLTDSTVVANVAVKDMDEAKQFYGALLGLNQVNESPGGITYESGMGKLFVYQAPTAGTNQATSASWEVIDVEGVVAALKSKGVTFEDYDIPGAEKQGDILVMGGTKAAWFKDPSGNILMVGAASAAE